MPISTFANVFSELRLESNAFHGHGSLDLYGQLWTTSISELNFRMIEAFLPSISFFIIDINTCLSVSSSWMCQTCTHALPCLALSLSHFAVLAERWPVSRWLLMKKLHICHSKSSSTVWGPPVKCNLVFLDGSEAQTEWLWAANVMCYAGELALRRVRLFMMQETPPSSPSSTYCLTILLDLLCCCCWLLLLLID